MFRIGSRIRRVVGWVLRPLNRRMIQYVPVGDPWEVVIGGFLAARGLGGWSQHHLKWCLDGQSAVPVQSVDEICRWLLECQYIHDAELFQVPDFWQHPVTFEHIRKGDCEDHALWAWRKLIELGHRPEFFIGQWFADENDRDGHHAWVMFERDGERLLLEATTKRDQVWMIRPWCDVREEYRPHFSVDHALTVRAHSGYLLYKQECARRELAAR